MTLMEWGPRPEPEPPPWTDAHPDPPYGFEVRPGVRTLGGGGFCHALVTVFCVFVICLVRPGCDMGLYVVVRIGVFVIIGITAE